MHIVFLGTGASVPTLTRSLPSILFKFPNGRTILFDVGEGTQYNLLRVGISAASIDSIYITHFHGDHYFGLPGLLSTMKMQERRKCLRIVVPRNTSAIVRMLMGLVGDLGFEVRVEEVDEGAEVFEDELVSVTCLRARHTVRSCMYLVKMKIPPKFNPAKARALRVPAKFWKFLKLGKSVKLGDAVITPDMVLEGEERFLKVLYTGDTAPVEFPDGVDVLIHDATFANDVDPNEVHKEGHSTAEDAGIAARRTKAGLLVLTHFSARYDDVSRHVEEARKHFPNVIAAEDLMRLVIHQKGF